MANKLIYTVCTGNYDIVRPARIFRGFDYWCFTDDPTLVVKGWTMKYIEPAENAVKLQRKIKILSHVYAKEYDVTMYIDANMEIIRDPNQLLRYYKGGLMVSIHGGRNNIKDEADKIVLLNKDTRESCDKTLNYAWSQGYQDDLGLWEDGIMIRDKSVSKLEVIWNDLVQEFSHRDQLTLPLASFLSGIKVNGINRRINYTYVKLNAGHHGVRKDFKIWYSNPWSNTKNIGGAINEFCSLIKNPNDWIVIQDGDICYLTSDWGKRIEDAIRKEGHKFGLLGCYTNRIRERKNCHNGEFSDNMDIKFHHSIAESYKNEGIEEIKHGIAGYFMAFQKKTFDLVGGFKENTITFDTHFNISVRKQGLKLGLIRNLYVWHSYRLWAKDPWSDEGKRHLT